MKSDLDELFKKFIVDLALDEMIKSDRNAIKEALPSLFRNEVMFYTPGVFLVHEKQIDDLLTKETK